MMRDPFGLEPDASGDKPKKIPVAGITDPVVIEAPRYSDDIQAIITKRSQEWMAGTGAARKGEPTAADKVGRGRDLTDQFNQRIRAMEATFGAVGNTMNVLNGGPISSYLSKIAAFGYIQYKGAKTEFMNPKAFKTSSFTKNGGGYVNGHYFSLDDFGNYFYGVAARSMGLLTINAVQGAGIYAIFSGSVTDWTNFYGLFDEKKDTRMILKGYYGK
jgi:hypothetical protein